MNGPRLIGQPAQPAYVVDPESGQGAMEVQPGRQAYPCVTTTFLSDSALAQIASNVTSMVIAALNRYGVLPPLPPPPPEGTPAGTTAGVSESAEGPPSVGV